MGIEWYWSKGPCKVCTRCSYYVSNPRKNASVIFALFCICVHVFLASSRTYNLISWRMVTSGWTKFDQHPYSIYFLWQVQNNFGMYLSLFWHFHLYSHYERRRRRCGIRSKASVFTQHSPLCNSSCFVFAARALVWWVFGDLCSILFYQYIWCSFQFSHERTLTRDSHILHPAQWQPLRGWEKDFVAEYARQSLRIMKSHQNDLMIGLNNLEW